MIRAIRSSSANWLSVLALAMGLTLLIAACSGETENAGDSATSTDDGGTDDGGDDSADSDDSADDDSTDGDDESTDDDSTDGDDDSTDDSTDGDDSTDDGSTDGDGGGGEIYDDPRGGIFAEFQSTIDRSHPFQTLDTFCVAHDEAADRVDTDPGITADAIEVHHMRSALEDLVQFGFGVEVGNVHEMFEFFIDYINTECGGIRGRQLDLGLSEWTPIDPAVNDLIIAGCVEATEDRSAVVAMNSSGMQGPGVTCMTEQNDTILITTQGLSTDFMERSNGRLVTNAQNFERALATMVNYADENGLLEGKNIAVVGSDQDGQPEAVESGLVNLLEELGHNVAVYETLQCEGGSTCSTGIPETVQAMLDADVDLVMPTVNILTAPPLIQEMVTQGYQPGEVEFMISGFNSADGDLVASKVKANGSPEAGALYDGALVISSPATSNGWSVDGWEQPRFNAMCSETYEGKGGQAWDWSDPFEGSPAGMVATVCSEVRVMARALYDAGENPTRADVLEALTNLGPVDVNNMIPSSISDGKGDMFDAVQTGTFASECPSPDNAYDDNNTCWVSNNDYVLIDG